jgi:putrescine transport system permease protein
MRARLRRLAILAPPALWLGLFFLLPFALVLRIAFSEAASGVPPYLPRWEGWSEIGAFLSGLGLQNFVLLATDGLYVGAFLTALRIAFLATLLTLLIGFPLAHAMARAPRDWQPLLVVAIILPFWTSFLIRVYAWIGILRPEGFLDLALMGLGLTQEPLRLLATEAAILIGMVYTYLPFMVLPIYAALEKQDRQLHEAAADLGATPLARLFTITIPLAKPGILAGCLLVFIPATGEFVIPDLLGGSETLMIGKLLWTEFFSNRDWPLASAVAVALLVFLLGPLLLYQRISAPSAGAQDRRV